MTSSSDWRFISILGKTRDRNHTAHDTVMIELFGDAVDEIHLQIMLVGPGNAIGELALSKRSTN